MQERWTALSTLLLFFELEWAALDDARVEELLAGDGLEFCRHHLRSARRYRPHLLSEPEERILSEKSISATSAWGRLFDELTSAIEVTLEEPVPLDVALSRLASPSREVRRETAAAVTRALEPGLRTRAFVFNTLLADKTTDRLLGAHIVGPHADEVINLFALAIRHDLTARDLQTTMFAYPTGASDIGYML